MDRSSPAIAPLPALHSEPDLTPYRAISPWAVGTLLAGLAAPLALLGPLLWWVPLVAIPLAFLAFRQLRQSDPRYVGQTAAVCGMCLAALFFGWSVTQVLSREIRSTATARELVDGWLKLVLAGQLREAHQIQSAASRRIALGSDLESYYQAESEAGKDLETFAHTQPLASLAGQQGKVELTFAEVSQHLVDGITDYFTLRYEIKQGSVPGSNGSLWIAAKRERRPDSAQSDWQVTSLTVAEPTSP